MDKIQRDEFDEAGEYYHIKEKCFDSIRYLKEYNVIGKKLELDLVDNVIITYMKIMDDFEKRHKCDKISEKEIRDNNVVVIPYNSDKQRGKSNEKENSNGQRLSSNKKNKNSDSKHKKVVVKNNRKIPKIQQRHNKKQRIESEMLKIKRRKSKTAI